MSNIFLRKVREFYVEAVCQIKKRLPIGDPVIEMLEDLDPDTNRAKFPSLAPLAVRFPNIVPEAKLQTLDDKWCKKGRERSILHMDYIKVLLLNKALPVWGRTITSNHNNLKATLFYYLYCHFLRTKQSGDETILVHVRAYTLVSTY